MGGVISTWSSSKLLVESIVDTVKNGVIAIVKVVVHCNSETSAKVQHIATIEAQFLFQKPRTNT